MAPTRHRYNVLASNLLYAAFFLPLLVDLITQQGFFYPNKPDANYVGVYAIMLTSLALYYGIRRGWTWAKMVFLLVYVTSILVAVWQFGALSPGIGDSPVTLCSYVLQRLLQVAAIGVIVLSFFKRTPPQPAFASEA